MDKGDVCKRNWLVFTAKTAWVYAVQRLGPQPAGKAVKHGLCPWYLGGHNWWGDGLVQSLTVETKC